MIPDGDEPSATLRLGLLSLGVCSVGGFLHFSMKGVNLEPAPGAVFVFLIYLGLIYIPASLGAGLALGTVGAAVAEGVSRRQSLWGLLLAATGASLEWFLWHLAP